MTTNYRKFKVGEEAKVCEFVDSLNGNLISVTNARNEWIVFFTEKIDESFRKPGAIIGPFKLEEKLVDNKWRVTCRICGLIKNVHTSNINKMKSCGCKPRMVDEVIFDNISMRYHCRKCNRWHTVNLPMMEEWCCNG